MSFTGGSTQKVHKINLDIAKGKLTDFSGLYVNAVTAFGYTKALLPVEPNRAKTIIS